MTDCNASPERTQATTTTTTGARLPFAPPELQFVGPARDVVLGPPGGGFDGPYGMTEPDFEFEEDGF